MESPEIVFFIRSEISPVSFDVVKPDVPFPGNRKQDGRQEQKGPEFVSLHFRYERLPASGRRRRRRCCFSDARITH